MGKILDLLAEIPTSAVLRERLGLIRDQAQMLENQVAQLHQENAELERRCAEMQSQLEAQAVAEEFVEHHGALFKRKPTGGYHDAVYCPVCHGPMSSLQGMLPYTCRCGVAVDFNGG